MHGDQRSEARLTLLCLYPGMNPYDVNMVSTSVFDHSKSDHCYQSFQYLLFSSGRNLVTNSHLIKDTLKRFHSYVHDTSFADLVYVDLSPKIAAYPTVVPVYVCRQTTASGARTEPLKKILTYQFLDHTMKIAVEAHTVRFSRPVSGLDLTNGTSFARTSRVAPNSGPLRGDSPTLYVPPSAI